MSGSGLLEGVEHAREGRWDEAHEIAQSHEGEPLFDWLHAVLHKIEGDTANARFWYRRAGRMAHVDDEAAAELEAIRAALA